MSHYSDCMLLWDWIDSAALPAPVQEVLERCLDELERYDRGLGRNVANGDWPYPAKPNPKFALAGANRKLASDDYGEDTSAPDETHTCKVHS